MRRLILALVLCGSPIMPAMAQSLPDWSANGACLAMGSATREFCVKSGEGARYEVSRAWGKIPAATRKACVDKIQAAFADHPQSPSKCPSGGFFKSSGCDGKPAPSWRMLRGCLKDKGAL